MHINILHNIASLLTVDRSTRMLSTKKQPTSHLFFKQFAKDFNELSPTDRITAKNLV